MTEHRCKDGSWKPGKTRDCPDCRPKRERTFTTGGFSTKTGRKRSLSSLSD